MSEQGKISGFGDVVVTGGAGALGTAVVESLLAAGATCHVPRVEAEAPVYLAQRVAAGALLRLSTGVDLTDEGAVERFYADLPALSASVHLAGGFAMSPMTETSLADFRAMMDMNATTCFLCSREAVRAMRRTGSGGGRIVNVAARPALVPTGGMVAYAASKAAVAAITLALAEELSAEGIWVNAIVPSIIDTPANRAAMPGADHGAWPAPAELAETITFLASPANRVTRGALVPVYGRS